MIALVLVMITNVAGTMSTAEMLRKHEAKHYPKGMSMENALKHVALPKEVRAALASPKEDKRALLVQRAGAHGKKDGPEAGGSYASLEKAREVLNNMYEETESDLDVTVQDCDAETSRLTNAIDINTKIRAQLTSAIATDREFIAEATLVLSSDKNTLVGLQGEWKTHTDGCDATIAAAKELIVIYEADMEVGQRIVNMTTCDETGENPDYSLLQCQHSAKHGQKTSFAFGGKMQGMNFRSKRGMFAMQRAAKFSLGRELGEHGYEKHHKSHYTSQKAWEEGEMHNLQHTTHKHTDTTTTSTTFWEVEESDPTEVGNDDESSGTCSVAGSPACPKLSDAIGTMVGEISFALSETKSHLEETQTYCDKEGGRLSTQVEEMETSVQSQQVKLADSISRLNENEESHRQLKDEFQADSKELADKTEECDDAKQEAADTMCGIKTVRTELYNMQGSNPYMQDCEVSEWVSGDEGCSVTCGGGIIVQSREVVVEALYGSECPPLSRELECNTFECPVDCVMGDWQGWSECSAECGGGLQQNHRDIDIPNLHGGMVCEATGDERPCNGFSCDADCVLSDWEEWSECSKQCNWGMATRRKIELEPARGFGSCVHPDSWARFEQWWCNGDWCPTNLVCNTQTDIVMVLDGSGSVGTQGFVDEKAFANNLLDRLNFGEKAAKVGIIKFSNSVLIEHEMSFDVVALKEKVNAMSWPMSTTGTAKAVEAAVTILDSGGRGDLGSDRRLIFIVTDGMPDDAWALKEATAKATGKPRSSDPFGTPAKARVIFVAVGYYSGAIDYWSMVQWASVPSYMNILWAWDFASLNRYMQYFIADLCPEMGCRESFTEAQGQDYRGCQDHTTGGAECQSWSSQYPQSHSYTPWSYYDSGIGWNNYCRNPDNDSTIWCYTTGWTRWDFCEARTEETWEPANTWFW